MCGRNELVEALLPFWGIGLVGLVSVDERCLEPARSPDPERDSGCNVPLLEVAGWWLRGRSVTLLSMLPKLVLLPCVGKVTCCCGGGLVTRNGVSGCGGGGADVEIGKSGIFC